MKTIYSEYKEKICTSCIHFGDSLFQDCEIRKCVNYKTKDNCRTRAKCYYYKKLKKRRKMKKERFEIGDELIFTGQNYNLARVFNYAEIFKDKKLIIESIQRCPCEENKNDKIKFKDIERLLSFYIF